MATPIPRNDAVFTLEAIAQATGGRIEKGHTRSIRGVRTDSRGVEPGNLFVAIRGEAKDGHDFIEAAVEAGAGAVLVERECTVPNSVACVRVEDSLRALGDLARDHRRRWAGRVIAVTGSAGKTTTKELIFAALTSIGYSTARSRGNLNNLVGLPMSILELDVASEASPREARGGRTVRERSQSAPEQSSEYARRTSGVRTTGGVPPEHSPDTAVLELGTSRSGEIARLTEIANPNIGVISFVGLAHAEGLGSLESIAKEKAALLVGLSRGSKAVAYGDERVLRELLGRELDSVIYFGRAPDSRVRLESVELDGLHTRSVLSLREPLERIEVELRLVGEAAALNAAAALAALVALGVGRSELAQAALGMSKVEPLEGRMNGSVIRHNILLLDDTYNANPPSVRDAISTAAELARRRSGRLLVVLGEMRELGPESVEAHVEIGRHAANQGAEALLGFGSAMAHAVSEVDARGILARLFSSTSALSADLESLVRPNDVVLVKGSRSLEMERVVQAFRQGRRA